MATCGHEESFIESPPSLEIMVKNYPLIALNEEIDRSTPRCRLCDLTAATSRESAAVYPPPTFSSRIEDLQHHIALAEQLIAEGIRKEELEATLASIQKMLTDEIFATGNRMLEAWKEHWAIWGLGEGPEMPNVYLEEVVEEESRAATGKKVKAPLNIKGKASAKKAKRF